MSMAWIRKRYHVPAKRGRRVEYSGGSCLQLGTIVGSRGGYLRIRLDGLKRVGSFHPTWELAYLEPEERGAP